MTQKDPKNTSADKKSRCRWLDGGKSDPKSTLNLTPKNGREIEPKPTPQTVRNALDSENP